MTGATGFMYSTFVKKQSAQTTADPKPPIAFRADFEQLVLATIVNVEIGTKDFGISAGEGEISFTLQAALQRELDELLDEAVEIFKQLI